MSKKFVQILCDVHCDWEGLAPVYRVYVNDELFAERTWIWTEHYLEEMLQIEAEPGNYTISFELVPPNLASMQVSNYRVERGPGQLLENTLRIV